MLRTFNYQIRNVYQICTLVEVLHDSQVHILSLLLARQSYPSRATTPTMAPASETYSLHQRDEVNVDDLRLIGNPDLPA
jgi:hypothetical protein